MRRLDGYSRLDFYKNMNLLGYPTEQYLDLLKTILRNIQGNVSSMIRHRLYLAQFCTYFNSFHISQLPARVLPGDIVINGYDSPSANSPLHKGLLLW